MHLLIALRIQELLTEDKSNNEMGKVFCNCFHPSPGSSAEQRYSDVVSYDV
jgi:hypothetical protein